MIIMHGLESILKKKTFKISGILRYKRIIQSRATEQLYWL